MQISKDEWDLYLDALKLARDRASSELADYMETLDFESNPEAAYGAVTAKAYELVQKYGNASATLASIMYDEISAAQHVVVPPAVPAMPAAPETVASIVSDVLSASATEEAFKHNIVQAIASETKRSAEDTMLQNANRDGAKFAWVCIGDTCAFCRIVSTPPTSRSGDIYSNFTFPSMQRLIMSRLYPSSLLLFNASAAIPFIRKPSTWSFINDISGVTMTAIPSISNAAI